jgi:hypothetical protein
VEPTGSGVQRLIGSLQYMGATPNAPEVPGPQLCTYIDTYIPMIQESTQRCIPCVCCGSISSFWSCMPCLCNSTLTAINWKAMIMTLLCECFPLIW